MCSSPQHRNCGEPFIAETDGPGDHLYLDALPRLAFAVKRSVVRPRARPTAAKGDLLVNFCERFVFGGRYQCGLM